jgi:hypothetical protein
MDKWIGGLVYFKNFFYTTQTKLKNFTHNMNPNPFISKQKQKNQVTEHSNLKLCEKKQYVSHNSRIIICFNKFQCSRVLK